MIKDDFKKCKYVFVYGTLKRSYGANKIFLTTSDFIDIATTLDKFNLYNVGFPIAEFNKRGHQIQGELYKLNSSRTLEKLDHYEGYPMHYDRKIVKVKTKNGEIFDAWIYYQKNFLFGLYKIKPNKENLLIWK